MAKIVNLKAQFETSGAVSSIKGFQSTLHGAEKMVRDFKSELQSATSMMKGLSGAAGSAKTSLDSISDNFNKTGREANNATTKVDGMTKALKGVASASIFDKMSSGFSAIGKDIVRTTKLLSAFAIVAGGVGFNKAKNEYVDYSGGMVGLQNVTGANTQGSKDILAKMVADISHNVGTIGSETIKNIVDTASGGITVDLSGKNGDPLQNAKNFTDIQSKIGLFGKSFLTDAKDVNKAVVSLGVSMGLSAKELNNPKKIDEILGLLGLALKNGVGSLAEYTTSIPKYISLAIANAKTPEEKRRLVGESLAIFTSKTLSSSPALAGFTAKSMTDDLGQMMRQSKASGTKITNLLKDKKDSSGNVIPFTFLGDAEKTAKIKKFLSPFENPDYSRKKIFLNSQGVQGSPLEVAGNLKKMIEEGNKATGVGKGELLSLFTTNVNTRRALLAYIDQESSVKELATEMNKSAAGQDYVNQAIANLQVSFSQVYSRVSADFSNFTNDVGNKLAPSLNAVAGLLSDMMTGGVSDMTKFNKVFNDNIANLKKSNPLLAQLAGYLKDFGTYVGTGGMREDFIAISDTVRTLITAIGSLGHAVATVWNSGPVKGLRDLLGGGAGADLLVALGGYSATKVIAGGLTSMAFSGLGNLIKAPFAIAGTEAGIAASTAFKLGLGSVGSIVAWGLIGVGIGTTIYETYKQLTDKDKKMEDALKFSTNSLSIQNPSGMTPSDKAKWKESVLSAEYNQVKLGGMPSEQSKLLGIKYEKLHGQGSYKGKVSVADLDTLLGENNTLPFLNSLLYDKSGKSKGTSYLGIGAPTPVDAENIKGLIDAKKATEKLDNTANDMRQSLFDQLAEAKAQTVALNELSSVMKGLWQISPNIWSTPMSTSSQGTPLWSQTPIMSKK